MTGARGSRTTAAGDGPSPCAGRTTRLSPGLSRRLGLQLCGSVPHKLSHGTRLTVQQQEREQVASQSWPRQAQHTHGGGSPPRSDRRFYTRSTVFTKQGAKRQPGSTDSAPSGRRKPARIQRAPPLPANAKSALRTARPEAAREPSSRSAPSATRKSRGGAAGATCYPRVRPPLRRAGTPGNAGCAPFRDPRAREFQQLPVWRPQATRQWPTRREAGTLWLTWRQTREQQPLTLSRAGSHS